MKVFGLLQALISIMLGCVSGYAEVTFRFSANSMESDSLKNRMTENISALLSEIDRAGADGDSLNLSGIDMQQEAKVRLTALWADSPFVCDKKTNISRCLQDFQGYQVRAIPITLKLKNPFYDQSLNRELSISLNKDGIISSVRLAWERNEDVNKILTTTGNGGVNETRMRREILKWIEDYRTLFSIKDLDGIAKIFDGVSPKKEYNRCLMETLDRMLPDKDFTTEIDYVSVTKHHAKDGIFGLTFRQKFNTGDSSEEGWCFFLWNFNDPERAQIHFRTWQPAEEVAKEGVYTLDDFFIP